MVAARECGWGIMPWCPLAGSFLAAKYSRGETREAGGRLSGENPFGDSKFTDRNWQILDVLRSVAAEVGCPPAQVALAWALAKSGVATVLAGASTPEQLRVNIGALEIKLTPDQIAALDKESAPVSAFPYAAFNPIIQRVIFGGTDVQGWR